MVGTLRRCAVRPNKKATTQGPRRLGPIRSCVAITALIWRSYQRLNRPAGERRGRDSNPRYRFKPVHRFSKPTPSASRPPLHNRINIDAGPTGFNWRRRTVIRGLVGCRTKPLHGHAGLHPREPVAPDTRASSIIMKRFSGQASIVRAQGQVRAGHGSDPGGGRTADYRSLRTG